GHSYGGPVNLQFPGGVATASFNLAVLPPGTHTVTATYNGDNNFLSSIGTLPGGQVVLITARTPTSTTLSSSANPSSCGRPVTFTANVSARSAGTPTGTVQFVVDGMNFGSAVALGPSGTATRSTATLSVGTHVIAANYSGDSQFAGSSGSVTQTV